MRVTCLSILILVLIVCCKKENVKIEGDFLSFSTDTLVFDTVFTTVGSATRYLKIYNNYNTDLIINSIGLSKKNNSSFNINIDGEGNHTLENILIRAQDSLYIFAEVTIDPNNLNIPIIETDAITFEYNNQLQQIHLVAWGRDAYFHSGIPDYQQYYPLSNNLDSMLYSVFFNSVNIPSELIDVYFNYYSIKENTLWTNDKPHVIYGDLIVENSATLTIQEGTEIYLHNNSWLMIDSLSTIESIGSINNLIWFQSDRSDSHSLTDYANTPGQWGKIWMLPGSINNKFEYTILKNGKTGLQVDGVNDIENLPNTPILTIKNSIIYNMSSIGIFAQGSKVYGENVLITNCGQHLLALNIGGSYNFRHCTFANFWPFSRQTPSIFLNNYYEDIYGNSQNRDLVQASFGNCIIDGNNEIEILFDKSDDADFNYNLNHCLLKCTEEYWNETWLNSNSQGTIILTNNKTTDFIDYESNNFELQPYSIAINNGLESIAQEVPFDINGVSRTKTPDIGCFENNN